MKFHEFLRIPAYVPFESSGPLAPVDPGHYCGVPTCEDGQIVSQDERDTVVECATHHSRTTHDTTPKVAREQQIIRVQDAWRQHGTQPPPGKR